VTGEFIDIDQVLEKYSKIQNKLSIRQWAQLSDVSAGYISLLVRRQRIPSSEVVQQLTKGLSRWEVTRPDLLATQDDKKLASGTTRRARSISGMVRAYPTYNLAAVTDVMLQAKNIDFQDTWVPALRIRFGETLQDAMLGGAEIRFLLMNPFRFYALRRSLDIGKYVNYVPTQIRDLMDDIKAIRKSYEEAVKEREGIVSQSAPIQVRFYDALPSVSQVICDDRVFFGFIPHGDTVEFAPQVEVEGPGTPVYDSLKAEFNLLWNKSESLPDSNFDDVTFDGNLKKVLASWDGTQSKQI
jgi:hypothetical protein